MPVTLKSNATFLRDKAIEAGLAQSKINAVMRQAAVEVGNWWVKNCLSKHFDRDAAQRYNYRRRSPRWTLKKTHAEIATDWNTGQKHPATHPPLDLVWSGSLRSYVLGAKSFYQAKATSKFAAGPQRQMVSVVVPIRLNHPLNTVNAGELTRLSGPEKAQMRAILFDMISRRLGKIMGQVLNWRAA